nr:hypothetical protein Itr_chr12CG15100 [Ipomoea trifida]
MVIHSKEKSQQTVRKKRMMRAGIHALGCPVENFPCALRARIQQISHLLFEQGFMRLGPVQTFRVLSLSPLANHARHEEGLQW